MGRRQLSRFFCFVFLVGFGGCGPDEDVELLALPPLERPSPEARLGIPEVTGVWRFAGWEIIEGDSTSLDRTFPSFGELRFQTQRLDSIAGSFMMGGTAVPVIGDVRRDGRLTFVTLAGDNAQSFVAGTYLQDTLWLELTSVLAADEWPQNARAAFVREAPSEPAFAWLRGARVVEPPPPLPVDSLATGTSAATGDIPPGATPPGGPATGGATVPGAGPTGQPRPAQQPSVTTPTPTPSRQPAAQPGPPAQQPAAQPAQQPPAQTRPPAQQQPAGQPAPPANQPGAQPPAQQPRPAQPDIQPAGPPPGPAQPPANQPAPEPSEPPAPPPAEPPVEDPGPLLGEPINP